jgi:hypothetical protein
MTIYSADGKWVIGGIDGFGIRMLIDPIPVLPVPPPPAPVHIPHELT